MLLQTNSYIVPEDRRAEHARLIRRFRQALLRIGCDLFETYEQVGANWSPGGSQGRFVQIMRFRDRQHQQAVQAAERNDAGAQQIIAEFCDLINFPYQQQHGYFTTGFYVGLLASPPRETFGFDPGATPASEGFGGALVEPEPVADEHIPFEENASEPEESQDESTFAPESEGDAEAEAEASDETDAEPLAEAAADEELSAESTVSEATDAESSLEEEPSFDAEPSLEEAEAEALADAEVSPESPASVKAIAETTAQETAAEVENPAEIADEFDFDLGNSPAAEPIEPASEHMAAGPESSVEDPEAPAELEAAAASEPTSDQTPEDAGAALISFLDLLTQEDLAADESVANEVDANGHLREVDPAATESGFAEDTIAAPVSEREATELVTADEFAPSEITEEVDPEATELIAADESASVESTETPDPAMAEHSTETEDDSHQDEGGNLFSEEEPTAGAEHPSESALEAPVFLETAHGAHDDTAPHSELDRAEPASAISNDTAVELEPFTVFDDELQTPSDIHSALQSPEANEEGSIPFDPIFDDPHLLNHAPHAIHKDSNGLHAEHEGRHDGHEPAAHDHAQGEEEENLIEFDAFLGESEGPSADAAHR